MKRFLLLAALALAAAGCGPLPVTIDLLPVLEEKGYDQQPFSEAVRTAPGTALSDLLLRIPDENGYALTFPLPDLPASPTSLVLDYRADLEYQIGCIDNLGGEIEAQVFLAGPSSDLWTQPLEGARVQAEIRYHDTLTLKGRASLTQDQLDAVLQGSLVLGVEFRTSGLSGQASNDPACLRNGEVEVTVSGNYQIERAVIEARFL